MTVAESKTIQVHPDDEKDVIRLMRIFQWKLSESQQVKTKNSHVERERGNLVAIEEAGYIKLVFACDLRTTLIEDEKKNYSFVKLVFSRDSGISYPEELKKLEEEYFSIQFPTEQNNPEKIAAILDECRMLYPDYGDVPQHAISPGIAIQSEKVIDLPSSAEGQSGVAAVADTSAPFNGNSPGIIIQPAEVIGVQSSTQDQSRDAVLARISNVSLPHPSLASVPDREFLLPDVQDKIEKHAPSDKSSVAVQANPHNLLATKGVTLSKPMLWVIGGIFLLLVGGGYYILHHRDDARLEELAKREAEIRNQQEKLAAKEKQALEQATKSQPTVEVRAESGPESITATAIADAVAEAPAPVEIPVTVKVPTTIKKRAPVKTPAPIKAPAVVASQKVTSEPVVSKANSNIDTDSAAMPIPTSEQKSIDEQYNERAAKECQRGFFGLLCRETMKLKLCDGKWTDNPPEGRFLCKSAKSVQGN